MLLQLYIKNFALIDELDIAFQPGFSVITGETGAGKSIILGALGLLLGNRADTKLIKAGASRCVIEGHFRIGDNHLEDFFARHDIDYEPDDCIMRREVNANGKSRAFLNDTPVALNILKELGEHLIDIHSQHQNLLLGKEDFQLSVVDTMAGNPKVLAEYREAYQQYIKAREGLETLRNAIEESRRNEDFLRFQFNELQQAHLEGCSQEQLEQDSETMSHAEEIKTALYEAEQVLANEHNGIVPQTKTLLSQLQRLSDIFPQGQALASRIDSCYIELKDICDEIGTSQEKVVYDPALLEDINEKLNTLYALQKKYRVGSVQELEETLRQIEETLATIDNSDCQLQEQERQVATLQEACQRKAAQLTQLRKKTVKGIEGRLTADLAQLGIPHVQMEIQITPKELGPTGADKVAFLFSANKNSPLQPISLIASGGEIARVMLALKAMLAGTAKLPTIIFDEIDTGVSGRVAESMAKTMRQMGQGNSQVISITHLPQIAALGTTHYKVAKQDTTHETISRMRLLSPEERVTEIAQMLSGNQVTQAAIDNAKSLLQAQP